MIEKEKPSFGNYTAIVLAGGKSSRMKKDKALLPLKGKKLIEVIIDQIKGFFSEILISVSETGTCDFLGYPKIVDEKKGPGPIMAILSGLKASSNDVNFFVSCDTPEINPGFLKKMLYYSSSYDIVVPVYSDGKFEPLFAIYNKNIINIIERQIRNKNNKIISFYPECVTKFIDMDNEIWYKNLNTIEDYETYIKNLDVSYKGLENSEW